jgi:hypothetical protein
MMDVIWRLTSDEIAERGEAIYAQRIRTRVEAGHQREFVVLDIESGDYEVDADDLATTERVLAGRSNAVLYGLRIGSPAAYRLGGPLRPILMMEGKISGQSRA